MCWKITLNAHCPHICTKQAPKSPSKARSKVTLTNLNTKPDLQSSKFNSLCQQMLSRAQTSWMHCCRFELQGTRLLFLHSSAATATVNRECVTKLCIFVIFLTIKLFVLRDRLCDAGDWSKGFIFLPGYVTIYKVGREISIKAVTAKPEGGYI